ncbi:MAG: T9SS type A sorting domain-containing protein, partial [Chitinophagaceae bacterium]
TVTSSGWTELTGVGSAINPTKPTSGTDITITALELSRGDYAASHVLYIGTSDGKLLRLINPRNAAANQAPTNITPTQLKGYISDIAVNPNNDAEIMVTLSNYTFNNSPVTNIFWTNNAKDASPTWYGLDGNLSTASFRSCMIVVKKDANNNPVTEYYAGTSVGLYSLVNVSSLVQSGNYSWTREGGTVLNYAVITSMDYRPQDNVLLIGTHGNGMYYTALSGSPDFRPNQNTGINDPVRNDKKFIQKVYPTVVDDRIRYQTGELFTVKKLIIKIFTTNGQLIAQKETGYASGEMDTRMLAKGTYLLTITSSDYQQQYVQQFVK